MVRARKQAADKESTKLERDTAEYFASGSEGEASEDRRLEADLGSVVDELDLDD